MTTVYYYADVLTDEDLPTISAEFNLPFELVEEVVARLKETGEVATDAYAGSVRAKIQSMLEVVSTTSHSVEPEVLSDEQLEDVQAEVAIIQTLTASIDGHYLIGDRFQVVVNPEAVPTVQDSLQAAVKVLGFKEVTSRADDSSNWLLGNLIIAAEDFHGDSFNISQVCEETDKSYNTCATAVGVCKAYGKSPFNLSFSHHKEAHYSKIDEDEEKNKFAKNLALKHAERHGLPAKRVRDMCNFMKRHGSGPLEGTPTAEQIDHLLEAAKELKADYLICNDKNQWTKMKTSKEGTRPTGRIVINLTTLEVTQDGLTSDIAKA